MAQNADSPIEIPERYEDVTAEWLTQALRSGGGPDGQTVTGFQLEPISAAKSRMSSLARISVEYDRRSEYLPKTLFAKFVSRIPGNREFARNGDLFFREVSLYRSFGSQIPMNMPKLYFGGVRNDSDIGILLLEEINAMSKDGVAVEEMSLTPTESKLALQELSKMHANWWGDISLRTYSWLRHLEDPRILERFQAHGDSWFKLRPVLEPVFSQAEFDICDGLSGYISDLKSELAKMSMTLCHGDFHVGNLLWDQTGEPDKMWVVDWQSPSTLPAVTDVGWFLGTGVPKQYLHLVRKDFLPIYHSELVSHGVANYEYKIFLDDYRKGLLDGLVKAFWIFANVDLAREDSVNFVRTIVGRMVAAAEEMGCGELLP